MRIGIIKKVTIASMALSTTFAVQATVILNQDFNTDSTGFVLSGNDGRVDRTGAESLLTSVGGGASLNADNTFDPGDGPNTNLNPQIQSDNFDVGSKVGDLLHIKFDYYEALRSDSTTFMLRSGTTGSDIGIQLILGSTSSGSVQVRDAAGQIDTGVHLALGTWYRVDITASPENAAGKAFELTITDASGNVVLNGTYGFRNDIADYLHIRWNFNAPASSDKGKFFIDNLLVETIPAQSTAVFLDQDLNTDSVGLTLNANSGVLDRTGAESDLTGVVGGASLNAENTNSTGNPEIRVDDINVGLSGGGKRVRIAFDYCRKKTSGAQTFFLRDAANTLGIHLFLNGSNAGEVRNFGGGVLATLALDTWYRFEIVAVPETNLAGDTYDLTISDTGGVVVSTNGLSFRNDLGSYDNARWFFNEQNTAVGGQYYLDNILVDTLVSPDMVLDMTSGGAAGVALTGLDVESIYTNRNVIIDGSFSYTNDPPRENVWGLATGTGYGVGGKNNSGDQTLFEDAYAETASFGISWDPINVSSVVLKDMVFNAFDSADSATVVVGGMTNIIVTANADVATDGSGNATWTPVGGITINSGDAVVLSETPGTADPGFRLRSWTLTITDAGTPTRIQLYDSWAFTYQLTDAATNMLADADGDLLDNLTEYAWGGNPTNGNDRGNTPVGSQVSANGTNYLQYVYYEREDAAARGLSSSVEVGTDLVYTNWGVHAAEFVGGGASGIAGYNAVTNRIPTDTEAKQFIKLKVGFTP